KNGNTASGGASRRCSKRITWMSGPLIATASYVRTLHADDRPAQRRGPGPAARRPRPRPGRRPRGPVLRRLRLSQVRGRLSPPEARARPAHVPPLRPQGEAPACRRPRARRRGRRRAVPIAHAVAPAAAQGRFWQLTEALYADQGRLEDPHLWAHCERLGIDL